ncbi:MAG: hypothetical protein ACRCRZ_00030 [Metamycoplasmataceae bacterium]
MSSRFRDLTYGIDRLANTGLKIGGAVFAGVAATKYMKKKNTSSSAIEQDQIELKKLEIEVQKAKLEAEKNKLMQDSNKTQVPQISYNPQESVSIQPALPQETSNNSQEKLLKSYELFKAGVITEEEYTIIKKQVLGI